MGYLYFFCSGEGKGESEAPGGGGGGLFLILKVPGGVGGFGGGGDRQAERVSAGIFFFWGGLDIFFRGRNAHQVIMNGSLFLDEKKLWTFLFPQLRLSR